MFLLLYKLFFLSHSLTRSARFEWLWLLINRLELKNFPSGISRLASDSTPDMPKWCNHYDGVIFLNLLVHAQSHRFRDPPFRKRQMKAAKGRKV